MTGVHLSQNRSGDSMRYAKIVRTRLLLDAPKRVVHDSLQMPDGEQVEWYYLDTPESVMVVPITKDENVILVRQFRQNLDDYTLELPAGVVLANESPNEAAVRELLEETGYGLDDGSQFVSLGHFYSLPSETNKWTHVFLAKMVSFVAEPAGDAELEKYFDMTVKAIPFVQALGLVGRKIQGMETVGALMLAQQHLVNTGSPTVDDQGHAVCRREGTDTPGSLQ